jgi:outer membrane protein assembly factor BamB
MKSRLTVLFLLLAAALCTADENWPQWRGAEHSGIADGTQMPPLNFSSTENVRWSMPIPGRGHGSAMVFGSRVFIAAADEVEKKQWLLCFDRKTGKGLWTKLVHSGGFPPKSNKKASQASSTPACDGERVIINFLNAGAVHTTAFSLDGMQLWQTKISDYVVHQGFSTSPAIYKSLVIVSADTKIGGAICGLDRKTGDIKWKVDRPKDPNYTSPMIYKIGGRDQLILQGCRVVTSLDPASGEKIWEHKGSTIECVSSIVTDGKHVFTSGGYDKNHVAAMLADGSGEVVWENTSRVYVPSMIVHDGYLYAIMDNGNAMCWECESGEVMWRERLLRTTSATPVMVGDRIYAVDEGGQFAVIKADPDNYEVLAKNQLGDQVFSTPTICGGEIFVRVAEQVDGKRKERLYCIGAGN